MKRIHTGLVLWLALSGLGCARSYRLEHTAAQETSAPRAVLRVEWNRHMVRRHFLDFRPQEWSTARFHPDGKRFYIGTSEGRFVALDTHSGRELWAFSAQGAIRSAPTLDHASKTIFFGADDGKLYALDSTTGKLRWSYTTQGTINKPPALSEGYVLFTTSEGRIYALDAASGKWRWQYDREMPEGFTIHGYAGVTTKGSTAYTGFADGTLVALRVYSGDVLWTRSLKGGKPRFVDVDATPVVMGKLLLTSSYSSGVHAVSLDNGSILWRYPVEGASQVTVHRGRVYFTAPHVGLVALDLSGHLQWRQAIAKGVPTRPVAAGPYLFVAGTETGLFAVEARSGRLLQYFDPGHGISAPPASADGSLASITNEGWLYLFQLPDPRES